MLELAPSKKKPFCYSRTRTQVSLAFLSLNRLPAVDYVWRKCMGRTVLSTVILRPQESITLTDATSGTYLATCVKDDVKKVLRFVIYK